VEYKGGRFGDDLEVKVSNRLRSTQTADPMLLVMLVLPKETDAWLGCTAQALSLKKCWVRLRGALETRNKAMDRVRVLQKNRFSAESLRVLPRRDQRNDLPTHLVMFGPQPRHRHLRHSGPLGATPASGGHLRRGHPPNGCLPGPDLRHWRP
jgi:hypothetical protein